MRKKRRVPEVLWRIFGHKARTLAETIESLLPPVDCRCQKRLCLRCCADGGDSRFLLLRPDDPRDYRELLSQCYVVVSEKESPEYPFTNRWNWTQHEVSDMLPFSLLLWEFVCNFLVWKNLCRCWWCRDSTSLPKTDKRSGCLFYLRYVLFKIQIPW